jgi:hypothetical protein
MTTGPKKCAHETCQCLARDGQKYCSTFCEDAKNVTSLQCDCGHPGCSSQKL